MERLRYKGRRSEQRSFIATAADGMAGAFSAEQLIERVHETSPGIGAATVYRTLSAMAAAGFVEPVGTRDGAVMYARCRSDRHHHHLLCKQCGAVGEADCDLAEALERIASASGFVVTAHELTLEGLCPACCAAEQG